MLVERRRHANDQGVRLARSREVIRYRQSVANSRSDALSSNVLDVATPVGELSDLLCIDVESEHGETHLYEAQSERQADISQSDDAHQRPSIPNFFQ